MLSITDGQKLFVAAFLLLAASYSFSELLLSLGTEVKFGCSLTEFGSYVWPSLNEEVEAVRRFSPRSECTFVLLKFFNMILGAMTFAIILILFFQNVSFGETLLRKSPAPFFVLLLLGIVCLMLFRSYPIVNFSTMEGASFRRYTLIRGAILSPLVTLSLISIGLLGPLVKDER